MVLLDCEIELLIPKHLLSVVCTRHCAGVGVGINKMRALALIRVHCGSKGEKR